MNVSIISTLFKRKEHSKKKIPNSLIKKHNIQIVKLKGNNSNIRIKNRIPQLNEKSKDTIYKEAIDYTVDHLHLISPKIKYQINIDIAMF